MDIEIRDRKCVALLQGIKKSAGWHFRHLILAIGCCGTAALGFGGLADSTTNPYLKGPGSIPAREERIAVNIVKYFIKDQQWERWKA